MSAFMIASALAFSANITAAIPTKTRAAIPTGEYIAPIGQTHFRAIDFVPWGWKLHDKVDGDLNGDGLADVAMVIQRNDPALMIDDHDGLGQPTYDANPRVLIVALFDENAYRIVGRAPELIPDHDLPHMDDPYSKSTIENGVLHLETRLFMSAGGWQAGTQRFAFRWNGRTLGLIGFDRIDVHRGSGELRQTSVNYLTGKRKDADGSIEDDETDWRWTDIPSDHRPVIGEIGNAFRFEG